MQRSPFRNLSEPPSGGTPEGYRRDANGRLHRPDGTFAAGILPIVPTFRRGDAPRTPEGREPTAPERRGRSPQTGGIRELESQLAGLRDEFETQRRREAERREQSLVRQSAEADRLRAERDAAIARQSAEADRLRAERDAAIARAEGLLAQQLGSDKPPAPIPLDGETDKTPAPKTFLGNKTVSPPTIRNGVTPENPVRTRLAAQLRFGKDALDYLSATHERGGEVGLHIRSEAQRIAGAHLRLSDNPIEQAEITHLDMILLSGLHAETETWLNRIKSLWKGELPDWLKREWEDAIEEGKRYVHAQSEAEGSDYVYSGQHALAALFFIIHTRLGPQSKDEMNALLRRAEHPATALRGKAGNLWPQLLREWFEEAKDADEGAPTGFGVQWNRVSSGIETVVSEFLVLCNKREAHILNKALDSSGITGWSPSTTSIAEFNRVLISVAKSSEGIRTLAAKQPNSKGSPKGLPKGAGDEQAHANIGTPPGDTKGKPKGKKGGKKGKGKGKGHCFNCGAFDHWSRECPLPPKQQGFQGAPAGGAAPPTAP
jgi:hypothetical protein